MKIIFYTYNVYIHPNGPRAEYKGKATYPWSKHDKEGPYRVLAPNLETALEYLASIWHPDDPREMEGRPAMRWSEKATSLPLSPGVVQQILKSLPPSP